MYTANQKMHQLSRCEYMQICIWKSRHYPCMEKMLNLFTAKVWPHWTWKHRALIAQL